ncbi:MAG TPA: signal peptidase II [Intrasporangium sp.]|uniref:signal peptidase II n=1 Tax=Intrasporangium sp. TaxID=1925024 RepID=UPI002D77FF97|nr:signal peptidase II [Intrasporangium sp.]HET7398516.1 signal peptidase II [Intrasporangium sp.]
MQEEPGTPLSGSPAPPRPSHVTAGDPAASGHAGAPDPRRRRRLFGLLAAVAVLAYASDQGSKAIASSVLADGIPRPLLGDVIRFRLIGNPGAALSLGAGSTWLMTVIALGVLVAIIVVSRALGSRAWAVALGLLLGSALGNLTDRFLRPPGRGQGRVVDFIDYRVFIGNVADIWIVGAAGLIVALALIGIGVDGRREHRATPSDAGEGRGA